MKPRSRPNLKAASCLPSVSELTLTFGHQCGWASLQQWWWHPNMTKYSPLPLILPRSNILSCRTTCKSWLRRCPRWNFTTRTPLMDITAWTGRIIMTLLQCTSTWTSSKVWNEWWQNKMLKFKHGWLLTGIPEYSLTTETIGQSYEGADLRIAKICRGGCGDKPAIYIEGGIHVRVLSHTTQICRKGEG